MLRVSGNTSRLWAALAECVSYSQFLDKRDLMRHTSIKKLETFWQLRWCFPNVEELGLKLAAQATVVHLMRRQIKSFTPTCCLGSTDGSRGPFCPPQRNHFLKQPRKVRLYVSPCVQLLPALNFIKKKKKKRRKKTRGERFGHRDICSSCNSLRRD